jgi:FkbM family methyltransferase
VVLIKLGKCRVSLTGVSDTDPYVTGLRDGADNQFAAFCAQYVRPADIALDIGANIGVTCTLLSQYLPEGHVYAFEPGPSVFRALDRNIKINELRNVSAFNIAVSDRVGVVQFVENSAWGHICNSGTAVQATSVDQFVAALRLPRVDVIKIDVEGFEQSVLAGAADTLARWEPVVFLEFNSWCLLAHAKVNPLDFLEWLFRRFEHVYFVRKTDGSIERITPDGILSFVHDNMMHRHCVDDMVVTNNAGRIL